MHLITPKFLKVGFPILPWAGLGGTTLLALTFTLTLISPLSAQIEENRFAPLDDLFRPANECRLASGAPGPAYWQQRADYKIEVRVEEEGPRISGKEIITYHNQSPHTLDYLWLQLDQNLRRRDSNSKLTEPAPYVFRPESFSGVYERMSDFDGGYKRLVVQDENKKAMSFTLVETNLRIDLETPLPPGKEISLHLEWEYPLNNARIEGRSGYEFFAEDGNYLFEIAQFYPRMCAYDDVDGWQNKPFYGQAEFALEFGDYEVAITVPQDYVVAATGQLQNPEQVLSKVQRERLEKAASLDGEPMFVITTEEAEANESKRGKGEKTWVYQAKDVRDFAFAASRKFAWQVGMVTVGDQKIMAQTLFPKEAAPLWEKFATHTVMHTLRTYSKYSVDYPYPSAIAVHGPVWGMEYPMICFCGGRPASGGYYSRQTKYSTIGVIIHEVGHNFFPMVVNSDERKWAWMDEGLNSFLEYLTELEFEPNFPHRRGPAAQFAPFMASPGHQPIMTNPESIISNGKTSYEKVAVGLKILRDLIMGPAQFDAAFRKYARRWAFRRPTPEDFFRSMSDYSGMDLDWFWRSWFYGADPVDIGLLRVEHFVMNQGDKPWKPDASSTTEQLMGAESSQASYYIDGKPELKDRYTGQAGTATDDQEDDDQLLRQILAEKGKPKPEKNVLHVYHLTFENVGGCPMPVPFEIIYRDGSRDSYQLPAEVWSTNQREFTKQIACLKEAVAMRLDPRQSLPDTDRKNNFFPRPEMGQTILDHDLRKK